MKKQPNKNKKNIIDIFNSFMTHCAARLNILLPLVLFTDKLHFLKSNPYTRLMRLDNLSGFWLFLLPAVIAITLGAESLGRPLYIIFIIIAGGLSARSAGCIVNDILDKKFDQKVKRTKKRPIASGELNKIQAAMTCAICMVIAFTALISLPAISIKLGFLTLILILVYPLAKRYFQAPQFFLGLVANMGVFIAWFGVNNQFSLVPLFIYFASIFWTIGYDTIYAIQDKEYDKKLGIGSTALLFGENNAEFVWRVYKLYLAVYFVLGFYLHLNILFFALLLLAAYHSYWQVKTLDDKDPQNCLLRFKSNVVHGMLILFAAVIGMI